MDKLIGRVTLTIGPLTWARQGTSYTLNRYLMPIKFSGYVIVIIVEFHSLILGIIIKNK